MSFIWFAHLFHNNFMELIDFTKFGVLLQSISVHHPETKQLLISVFIYYCFIYIGPDIEIFDRIWQTSAHQYCYIMIQYLPCNSTVLCALHILTYLIFLSILREITIFIPILQIRQLRRRSNGLFKVIWQVGRWHLNPNSLTVQNALNTV